MSNQSEAREAIASAASGVEGVSVSPYYRQQLRAGTGSVRFVRVRKPDNGFGWLYEWSVSIATSANAKTHEVWMENHLEEVCEALGRELDIQSASDAELVYEGASIFGVVIAGTRGEA